MIVDRTPLAFCNVSEVTVYRYSNTVIWSAIKVGGRSVRRRLVGRRRCEPVRRRQEHGSAEKIVGRRGTFFGQNVPHVIFRTEGP